MWFTQSLYPMPMNRMLLILFLVFVVTSCKQEYPREKDKQLRMLESVLYNQFELNAEFSLLLNEPTILNEEDSFFLIDFDYDFEEHKDIIKYDTWMIPGDTTKVNELSLGLIKYIDVLKEKIIEQIGGIHADGSLHDPNDKSFVNRFFFSEDNPSVISDLTYTALKRYRKELQGKDFELELEPKEFDVFRNDPNYNQYDFADLHFKNATGLDALIVLTTIQLRVLYQEEAHYLKKLQLENGHGI